MQLARMIRVAHDTGGEGRGEEGGGRIVLKRDSTAPNFVMGDASVRMMPWSVLLERRMPFSRRRRPLRCFGGASQTRQPSMQLLMIFLRWLAERPERPRSGLSGDRIDRARPVESACSASFVQGRVGWGDGAGGLAADCTDSRVLNKYVWHVFLA